MKESSKIDFTISVFLFCTFKDFSLILMKLSINFKKQYRFCNQQYLYSRSNEVQFKFLNNVNKLIALSWIIEIKSSSRLIKTWFESEFLTWVFKSSQKIRLEYLSWVRRLRLSIDLKFSTWFVKTWSEVLLIFIWMSDNATE